MQISRIEQLEIFKLKEKFSEESFRARGMYPPKLELRDQLNNLINKSCEILIQKIKNNSTEKNLQKFLKNSLYEYPTDELSTEEREFICDLFYEISQIVEVDFRVEAYDWLYGDGMASMHNVFEENRAIKKTYKQHCEKCHTALESFVIQEEDGIPQMDWMIIQCNNCQEYNLLDLGIGIKELGFGNYKLIESLPRINYDKEQVSKRLLQLRNSKYN
jgi:hypothetical protein